MSQILDPTEYVIRTRFDVKEEVPGLTGVTHRLGRIEGLVGNIGSSITSRIGGALAGVAAGAGLSRLTRGIVGLHTEVQNAEMGIGSLISALTKTDMNSALGMARSQLKGLQADAAAGAGELRDYTEGFQTILGPLLGAGASLDQVRQLNRLALTAGFALRGQEGLRLAPLDVIQSMTAGVSDRTTPIVNAALQAIGVTADKFNAMTGPDKIRTLERAFGSFEEAANAMGRGWDAQMATMKDRVKGFVRTATQPVFESWTDQLQRANEWLEKNRVVMEDMALRLGSKLGDLYDRMSENAGGIGSAGAGVAAAGVGGRLAMVAGGPFAALAAFIGAGIGAIVLSISQALQTYPQLVQLVGKVSGNLGMAFGSLGEALLGLIQNPAVAWLGRGFANWLALFGAGLTVFVRIIDMYLRNLNTAVEVAFDYATGLGLALEGRVGESAAYLSMGRMKWQSRQGAFTGELQNLFRDQFRPTAIAPGTGPEEGAGGGGGKDVPKNVTNFNGPVTVTVQAERLDDPNLVATTFEAVLQRLRDYPRTSTAGRLVPRPV